MMVAVDRCEGCGKVIPEDAPRTRWADDVLTCPECTPERLPAGLTPAQVDVLEYMAVGYEARDQGAHGVHLWDPRFSVWLASPIPRRATMEVLEKRGLVTRVHPRSHDVTYIGWALGIVPMKPWRPETWQPGSMEKGLAIKAQRERLVADVRLYLQDTPAMGTREPRTLLSRALDFLDPERRLCVGCGFIPQTCTCPTPEGRVRG